MLNEIQRSLNTEQAAAATAPDGPVLVLAAAGTGKTRTLVYRVAYLVDRGHRPDRILLLTFTNKAAKEMLERAAATVGGGVGGLWGGTFHHLANRILRRNASLIGYPSDFTILDRDDSRSLVEQCVKELKLRTKEFPKKEVLLAWFSTAANTGVGIGEYVQSKLLEFAVDTGDVVRIAEMYRKRKRELLAMDFDDLLVTCLDLFRQQPQTLARYQDQFEHVLVDEYQDTNLIQAELVDILAAGRRNIFVVGDDFQSIYGWRGANYRNIITFPERYAGTTVFKLETNYRSAPEILAVANACIAGNPDQFQKTLRAVRPPRGKPRLVRVREGGEQARYIVEDIRRLRREGMRLRDIAILYRAHFHALELQMELTRAGMPHVITSGLRFFEQAHIKDVCALVRVLQNPADELSFVRVLSMFPGIGEKTAQKIWKKMGGKLDPQSEPCLAAVRAALKGEGLAIWTALEPTLKAFKDESLFEDPGEVIHQFVASFYAKHAANTFEDADRRMDDIEELVLYSSRYETAEAFLADISLMTNMDAEAEQVTEGEREAVRLSTVHQAKGLEWRAVYVIWLADGMFPSTRTMNESLAGEAEERRLFYVAVTRAADELTLMTPEIRRTPEGGFMPCTVSRFVKEIPPACVRPVSVGFI